MQPINTSKRTEHDGQEQLCVPFVVTEGESFRMKEARSRAGGHAVRTTSPTTTTPTTRRAPGGPTSTSVA